MSANERQVGGLHYKRDFQHWDLVALANAGYFAGQITKYTERHSRKNGQEDLEKALHFAEKMHEVRPQTVRVPQYRRGFLGRRVPFQPSVRLESPTVLTAVRDYAVDAGLTAIQERIFEYCLVRPDDTETIVSLCRKHLEREYGSVEAKEPARAPFPTPVPTMLFGELSPAQEIMKREMLEKYETVPPSPEDGGHHESRIPQEIEDQVDVDLNIALAEAIAAQRPNLEGEVEVSIKQPGPPLRERRTPPEKPDPRKK